MASLKEIKNRIASVRSTLKITSSMKMVASAKLHRAQSAVENMRPYEAELTGILRELSGSLPAAVIESVLPSAPAPAQLDLEESGPVPVVAIVAFASNSSLCGAFNSNVIKAVKAEIESIAAEGKRVEVISVGRKMAEAMNRAGYLSAVDCTELAAHAAYDDASSLAQRLVDAFQEGRYESVRLVYNHFVSTASQVPTSEVFLPMESVGVSDSRVGESLERDEFILEPDAEQLLRDLLPKVLRLRFFATVLDSAASEHAARTVAMQTASDNAENILSELTLEYNKSRQQKITSEILDLVGGSMLQ